MIKKGIMFVILNYYTVNQIVEIVACLLVNR